VEWEMNEKGMPAKFAETPGSDFELKADLVLLAMGFTGPADKEAYAAAGLEFTPRGSIATDADGKTNLGNVFAAGDIATGPSLVVRAMTAGANLADSVARFLGA
jgi:glutamate synthase (NADPH/NADH) small chain